ncbi:SRPBCC domain-containing protein [Amnibacterium flavum]|uniref:Activator of Hsp90 ATPase homologue 1/2-like C-terminal domain-containing protein n=1 Tax=Amnibacterium flavum TaxID=2173173 RepID=A0A2V1HM04_9MICO|nr:SRPBCC domain-containing protein [Amnibacterium flavum]PVZ93558.1 hypothetical protein DDQ50_14680 [Amnibacterium flavum]
MTSSGDAAPAEARGADADGVIERDGDRWSVRFVRFLDTDIDTAWRLMSEPEQLARWFEPALLDRDGGYHFDGDEGLHSFGKILYCAPPTSYSVTWTAPGDEDSPSTSITVTVAERDGGGVELTLEHRGLGAVDVADYGAGWHAYLDRLVTSGSVLAPLESDWSDRFADRRPRYLRMVDPTG